MEKERLEAMVLALKKAYDEQAIQLRDQKLINEKMKETDLCVNELLRDHIIDLCNQIKGLENEIKWLCVENNVQQREAA